jgi:hypothetical protein
MRSSEPARTPSAAQGRALLVVALGSVLAFALAMRAYPGGTIRDRATHGHRFWSNFFCDLFAPVALNRAPDPLGSRLSILGAVLACVALALLWAQTGREIGGAAGRVVRRAGLTCVALFPLVLLSGFAPRWVHAIAAIGVTVPGLLATGLAAYAMLRDARFPRSLPLLALATMSAAALDALVYGWEVAHGGGVPLLLMAGTQKLAALLLLAWMLLTGWRSAYAGRLRR